jgi:hypothetical protein
MRLVGGLGNQIFTYFAGVALAEGSGRRLEIDISDVSHEHSQFDIRSFEITAQVVGKDNLPTVGNLFKRRVLNSLEFRLGFLLIKVSKLLPLLRDSGFEKNISFQSRYKRIFAKGYFQDFRYFELASYPVRESFKLKSSSRKLGQLRETVTASKSVAIHVRRGDFVAAASYHGCLSADWYEEVLSQILSTNPQIEQLWFFSNDTDWCKESFSNLDFAFDKQIIFLGEEDLEDPAEVLVLFGDFEIKVCANSTFSILAAALGKKSDVFVPSVLNRTGSFKNLELSLPKEWVRIPPIWE